MSTVKTKPPRFRPGDWVTFRYGVMPVIAQIIEDRGPLAGGGRRLYRIRLEWEHDASHCFEMPEQDLEKIVPDEGAMARYREQEGLKDAVLQYLKQGGLVKILRTNIQGDRPVESHPKAWLTCSPRRRVSYTLTPGPAAIGSGATVPFWALEEDQIRPHKRPDSWPS